MLHKALTHAAVTFLDLSQDSIRFFRILLKSRSALASENLFLRKQLALYQERNVPPKRATDATRLSLVLLGKPFEWKGTLRVVRMETFVDWHRKGFKLKTPFRSPQPNSYCERLIGGIRRECLDFLIPISEGHLKRILKERKIHYNQDRPHSSLGPGLPEAGQNSPVPIQKHRHQLQEGYRVKSKAILGGLHHEYRLEKNRCLSRN